MPGPRLFPDEIAARLRDLKHGDKVIIKDGFQEKHSYCCETARNEDGIVSTWRRFETQHGIVVDNIVTRLYDASEAGCTLMVTINNSTEPF